MNVITGAGLIVRATGSALGEKGATAVHTVTDTEVTGEDAAIAATGAAPGTGAAEQTGVATAIIADVCNIMAAARDMPNRGGTITTRVLMYHRVASELPDLRPLYP